MARRPKTHAIVRVADLNAVTLNNGVICRHRPTSGSHPPFCFFAQKTSKATPDQVATFPISITSLVCRCCDSA